MLRFGRNMSKLTHLGDQGQAKMVNINDKVASLRVAKARGKVVIGNEAFQLVEQNLIKKGDALGVARIAGIMGAKKTSELIPLCHPLILTNISIDFDLHPQDSSITVQSSVSTYGKTGVEMEAITAVTIACVNIYDMCKAINKEISITDIELISKQGGKSDYNKI